MMIDSSIQRVKIYHNGATIYRVGTLEIKPDALPEEVEFPGLPLSLQDETVRIWLEGPDGSTPALIANNLRVGLYAPPRKESNNFVDKALQKRLQKERKKKEELLKHIGLEEQCIERMELPKRPQGEQGKPPPSSPMAARIALENFSNTSLEQRIEERTKLKKELKSLDEQLEEIARTLLQTSSAKELRPEELKKTVLAGLQTSGEPFTGIVKLHLSYAVPGARWAPSYQCRLDRTGQKATVHMRALISQKSGEDWEGAMLSLSTASPTRWTETPKLSSLRIGKAQPPTPKTKGFRPPPKGAALLYPKFDRERANHFALVPRPTGWSPEHPETPEFALVDDLSLDTFEDRTPSPAQISDMLSTASFSMSGMGVGGGAPKGGGYGGLPTELLDEVEEACAEVSEELSFDDDIDDFKQRERMEPPRTKSRAAASPSKPQKKRARLAKKSAMEFSSTTTQMHHHQLCLGAGENPLERNKLLPIDLRQRYLQILRRETFVVTWDVMEFVASAEQQAHQTTPIPDIPPPKNAAGHFDYTYETDQPVDVPSDGGLHSVIVNQRDADCVLRYVVVPREDPHVYRMAHLKNPMRSPLLPGPVELYVGGEYILTSDLPLVAPEGKFQLWLGVEQAIKCARNTRFEEVRSGSKVVAMTELQHTIEIELVNHLGREIECEIRERIPQPATDAEVVVEEGQINPPWEVYEQEERGVPIHGGRRWSIQIPPKENAHCTAEYVIKIYANNEIAGGNRREA